jgi:hypothetical protein
VIRVDARIIDAAEQECRKANDEPDCAGLAISALLRQTKEHLQKVQPPLERDGEYPLSVIVEVDLLEKGVEVVHVDPVPQRALVCIQPALRIGRRGARVRGEAVGGALHQSPTGVGAQISVEVVGRAVIVAYLTWSAFA